jgi:hypothetical protein
MKLRLTAPEETFANTIRMVPFEPISGVASSAQPPLHVVGVRANRIGALRCFDKLGAAAQAPQDEAIVLNLY